MTVAVVVLQIQQGGVTLNSVDDLRRGSPQTLSNLDESMHSDIAFDLNVFNEESFDLRNPAESLASNFDCTGAILRVWIRDAFTFPTADLCGFPHGGIGNEDQVLVGLLRVGFAVDVLRPEQFLNFSSS